jgi:hypothetical protein
MSLRADQNKLGFPILLPGSFKGAAFYKKVKIVHLVLCPDCTNFAWRFVICSFEDYEYF